jgi:heme exporter protein C
VTLLSLLAALLMAATYARVIWFTPPDALQGMAQKIYYIHVPSAVMAYIAFSLVAVASVFYLALRDERLDRLAESSAEVAVVFTTVVLLTGPLWGKPVWGAWWVWEDMRLTLTLFLWFIGVGYLVLRGAVTTAATRARYSAVLGVLAALLIPFIHLSVYLFRTQHPQPIVLQPGKPKLSPEMLNTLLLSALAFLAMFVAMLRARLAIARSRAMPSQERVR